MKPNPCNVLAIDGAKQSGVAYLHDGGIEAAEVETASNGVEWWVKKALLDLRVTGRPLVIVGESGMAKWYGQRGAWTRWRDAAKAEWKRQRESGAPNQPAPKYLTVHVNTWRSKVFSGRVGSKQAKKLAVQVANQRFQLHLGEDEHNAAESACIAYWAMYAPEVREIIPQRWR